MDTLRRREHGLIIVMDPEADRPVFEMPTVQCVHCGAHFVPEPGSGRVRGFCFNCCGPICGPGCQECVPQEQLLENIEKGRAWDYRPVVAAAGWDGAAAAR